MKVLVKNPYRETQVYCSSCCSSKHKIWIEQTQRTKPEEIFAPDRCAVIWLVTGVQSNLSSDSFEYMWVNQKALSVWQKLSQMSRDIQTTETVTACYFPSIGYYMFMPKEFHSTYFWIPTTIPKEQYTIYLVA